MFAAGPTRNRSEPLHRKKFTEALYLLGNIQSGKSEKKLSSLEGVPDSLQQSPYLLKEHPNGKKKESISTFFARPKPECVFRPQPPTYIRNIEKGKKEKESSVPVQFSEDSAEE